MCYTFDASRWVGNGWASIEVEPHNYGLFHPLLQHLAATYGFQPIRIDYLLDAYAADFQLSTSAGTWFVDIWGMSLAFEHDAVRDEVLAHLRSLPADFFPAPSE